MGLHFYPETVVGNFVLYSWCTCRTVCNFIMNSKLLWHFSLNDDIDLFNTWDRWEHCVLYRSDVCSFQKWIKYFVGKVGRYLLFYVWSPCSGTPWFFIICLWLICFIRFLVFENSVWYFWLDIFCCLSWGIHFWHFLFSEPVAVNNVGSLIKYWWTKYIDSLYMLIW